jgi:hypothetical protein
MQVKVNITHKEPESTVTAFEDIESNKPFVGKPDSLCNEYIWIKLYDNFESCRHCLVCIGNLPNHGILHIGNTISNVKEVENLRYLKGMSIEATI